jgi:nucleolar protein 56
MRSYLTYTVFGVFLFNEESEVLAKELTYPNLERSVENVRELNSGNITDPFRNVVSQINSEGPTVVLTQELAGAISTITNVPTELQLISPPIKWFHAMHDTFLINEGIVKSNEELAKFRRQSALMLARSAIREASEEKDLSLKHAIDGIEEIDKSINILAMRLREWYSLHFPLLNDILEDHEQFARVVTLCGRRSTLTIENLSKTKLSESDRDRILKSSSDVLGAEMSNQDIQIIQSFAQGILDLYSKRRELEDYVSIVMYRIAPNITSLVGPLVGARLISLAGSLKDLARKPSSTLQILGAEKALFRSLKTGAAPPKHGVIFQVPEIHSAPYWQRGKIARALSGKLSIAARIDAYSDSTTPTSIRKQFEVRLAEIRKQNPEPPPPKPTKPSTKPQKPASSRRKTGHAAPRDRRREHRR